MTREKEVWRFLLPGTVHTQHTEQAVSAVRQHQHCLPCELHKRTLALLWLKPSGIPPLHSLWAAAALHSGALRKHFLSLVADCIFQRCGLWLTMGCSEYSLWVWAGLWLCARNAAELNRQKYQRWHSLCLNTWIFTLEAGTMQWGSQAAPWGGHVL